MDKLNIANLRVRLPTHKRLSNGTPVRELFAPNNRNRHRILSVLHTVGIRYVEEMHEIDLSALMFCDAFGEHSYKELKTALDERRSYR